MGEEGMRGGRAGRIQSRNKFGVHRNFIEGSHEFVPLCSDQNRRFILVHLPIPESLLETEDCTTLTTFTQESLLLIFLLSLAR